MAGNVSPQAWSWARPRTVGASVHAAHPAAAQLPLDAVGITKRGLQAGGEVGPEHLDGDRPVVLEIAGEVDRGHTALPDLAIEQVAVTQRFAKLTRGVGHEAA